MLRRGLLHLLGGVAGDPRPMQPQPGVAGGSGDTTGQASTEPVTGEGYQPPPPASESGGPATLVQQVPDRDSDSIGSNQPFGEGQASGSGVGTPGPSEVPRGTKKAKSSSQTDFFAKYSSPQLDSLRRKTARTRLAHVEQPGDTPAGPPGEGVRLNFVSPQSSTLVGSPAVEASVTAKECCPLNVKCGGTFRS